MSVKHSVVKVRLESNGSTVGGIKLVRNQRTSHEHLVIPELGPTLAESSISSVADNVVGVCPLFEILGQHLEKIATS